MRRLSATSGRSSAGPFTLVLRAAFVPDGEQPPPELAADFSPLKFRATIDRTTGVITCENAGMSFGGDIQAEWHTDDAPDRSEGDSLGGIGNDTGTGGSGHNDPSPSRGSGWFSSSFPGNRTSATRLIGRNRRGSRY